MPPPRSEQALTAALSRLAPGASVLDVGAGDGEHARAFMEAGHAVTVVELRPAPDWWPAPERHLWCQEEFPKPARLSRAGRGYDLVWCAHVLEHLPDVGSALDAMRDSLEDDGILTITVPPRKDEVVGGHRNLFNLGTLAYNLILAGFDCSAASFGCYGYNLSAIVSASELVDDDVLGTLSHDHGDIERLAAYFPPEWNARQGFDGASVPDVRWI